MDDMDNAQQRQEQEQELSRAIEAARGVRGCAVRVEQCVECGGDIEPVRVDRGLASCAECANWLARLRLGGGL